MSEFREVLRREAGRLTALSDEQVKLLAGHYDLMVRWNDRLNLTRVTRLEEAVVRHYCESLLLGLRIGDVGSSLSIADLGSGAGFPGVPVAILRPEWSVTLIESHQRKAVFLREAVRFLPNVQVADCRAESFERGSFDWVISRAVRWEDVLSADLAASVALLLSGRDAEGCAETRGFTWNRVSGWPLDSKATLLIGREENVPRETQS